MPRKTIDVLSAVAALAILALGLVYAHTADIPDAPICTRGSIAELMTDCAVR